MREEDGGDAERPAEELLGMPVAGRSHRRGREHGEGGDEWRPGPCTRAPGERHAERGCGRQARHDPGAVDAEVAGAEPVGRPHERRAQHDREGAHEERHGRRAAEAAVRQRSDRRPGVGRVVAEPGDEQDDEAAGERQGEPEGEGWSRHPLSIDRERGSVEPQRAPKTSRRPSITSGTSA